MLGGAYLPSAPMAARFLPKLGREISHGLFFGAVRKQVRGHVRGGDKMRILPRYPFVAKGLQRRLPWNPN